MENSLEVLKITDIFIFL